MTVTLPVPFRSSRVLSLGDDLLPGRGVALDVVGIDWGETLDASWRHRVEQVASGLGWPVPQFAEGRQGGCATLGFTAPIDQLLTAREANEWALCAALLERDPVHWSALHEAMRDAVIAHARLDAAPPHPAAALDETAALAHLRQSAGDEARRAASSRA
jgi:hypothetical protein